MNISKASNYAICSLVYLATNSNKKPIDVGEIATRMNITPAYLAKIFQHLSRARLVYSQRGPKGGYTLAYKPENITLLDIIEAVEGVFRSDCHDDIHDRCQYIPFCRIPEKLNALSEKKKSLYDEFKLKDLLDLPDYSDCEEKQGLNR
jgi:Rrf2 family protein